MLHVVVHFQAGHQIFVRDNNYIILGLMTRFECLYQGVKQMRNSTCGQAWIVARHSVKLEQIW